MTEGVLASVEDEEEEEEKPKSRIKKTLYNLTKGNEKVREYRSTRIKGRTQRTVRTGKENEVQLEKLTEAVS